MTFRIAIGRCDCQSPYRTVVEGIVCDIIRQRLSNWRSHLPADVAAVPNESFEEQIVEGYHVTFGTYKQGVNTSGTLIVCQALLHTWSRPTFLSIGAVGRMYAEGLLVTNDGNVESASDDLMWEFR